MNEYSLAKVQLSLLLILYIITIYSLEYINVYFPTFLLSYFSTFDISYTNRPANTR